MSQTFTVGALGDSITVGFNAEQSGENKGHSWVTGMFTEGESHVQRIQRLYPNLKVQHHNVAFNGARAADLNGQTEKLLMQSTHGLDYATLLIGANDLVRWLNTSYDSHLQEFLTNVEQTAQKLVKFNERILLLLVAVPDQSRIIQLLNLGASAFTSQLMGLFRERFTKLNDGLAKVASRYPANVRFVSSVSSNKFDREHLSTLDFYHPSVAGQKLLADLTWSEGFFPTI